MGPLRVYGIGIGIGIDLISSGSLLFLKEMCINMEYSTRDIGFREALHRSSAPQKDQENLQWFLSSPSAEDLIIFRRVVY